MISSLPISDIIFTVNISESFWFCVMTLTGFEPVTWRL